MLGDQGKKYVISRASLKEEEEIGSGGFGRVYRARYGAQDVVAVKEFRCRISGLSQRESKMIAREIEILSGVRNRRIVQFEGVVTEGVISIVMEHLPLGNLHQYYDRDDAKMPPFQTRLSLGYDVAFGMNYLHLQNPCILHNDLKSSNILLCKEENKLRAKIADFGLSHIKSNTHSSSNATTEGTFVWKAPEIAIVNAGGNKVSRNSKTDIFSFGVVLTELSSWKGPYGSTCDPDVENRIRHCFLHKRMLPKIRHAPDVPDTFQHLCIDCISWNPDERPEFDVIVWRMEKMLQEAADPNREPTLGEIMEADAEVPTETADIQPPEVVAVDEAVVPVPNVLHAAILQSAVSSTTSLITTTANSTGTPLTSAEDYEIFLFTEHELGTYRLVSSIPNFSPRQYLEHARLDQNLTHNGSTRLHLAARHGEVSLVQAFLRLRASVTAENNRGETPVYLAACEGHVDVLRILADEPDPESRNLSKARFDRRTPLHAAAARGHKDVVEFLLRQKQKVDINALDRNGETPLMLAERGRHTTVIDLFTTLPEIKEELKAYEELRGSRRPDFLPWRILPQRSPVRGPMANIAAPSSSASHQIIQGGSPIGEGTVHNDTRLHIAARFGLHSLVMHHLPPLPTIGMPGEWADILGKDQRTPLHWAAWNGHVAVLETLIDHAHTIGGTATDAVAAPDLHGITPLILAASNGQIKAINTILQHQVDVNTGRRRTKAAATARGSSDTAPYGGLTALHAAAKHGHMQAVRLLLANGANILAQDNRGWTPLHFAVSGGHIQLARLLLLKGTEELLHASTVSDSSMPIHIAAESGCDDMVATLLHVGAIREARDRSGNTALHRAAKAGAIGAVRHLLEWGVSLDARNSDDWAPLHVAAYHGRSDIITLLLDNDANVSVTDRNGWTPMHTAALNGQVNALRTLFDRGGNLDAEQDGGKTPLVIAIENRKEEAIQSVLALTEEFRQLSGWRYSRTRLKEIREVGSGAQSRVYKAKYGVRGFFAVKEFGFRASTLSQREAKMIETEIRILSTLRCPQLVQFHGIVIEGEISIVMEYLPLGSLLHFYDRPNSAMPPFQTRLGIAYDIAFGMTYLHSRNPYILHNRLKSSNILLYREDEELRAKIVDFGLLRMNYSTRTQLNDSNEGFAVWKAPEIALANVDGRQALLFLDCSDMDPAKRPEFHAILERLTIMLEQLEAAMEDADAAVPAETSADILVAVNEHGSAGLNGNRNGNTFGAQFNKAYVISRASLTVIEEIGSGGYGRVYKANHGVKGVVAVKEFLFRAKGPAQIDEKMIEREIQILSNLKHQQIVQFVGVVIEGKISLVMEYLPLGSLHKYYDREDAEMPPFQTRLQFAIDIASGMDHLHSHTPSFILHNDLKSPNILLYLEDKKLRAKIADFGLSKIKSTTQSMSGATTEGTFAWKAPEIAVGYADGVAVSRTKKTDIFSFGVVLTELSSWTGPYGSRHPLDVPKQFQQLCLDCMDLGPAKRPEFDVILARLKNIIDEEVAGLDRGSAVMGITKGDAIICMPPESVYIQPTELVAVHEPGLSGTNFNPVHTLYSTDISKTMANSSLLAAQCGILNRAFSMIPAPDCCTFPAVFCNRTLNVVESLNMSNYGLTGEIPSALAELTTLKELFLFNNKLSGPIPSWLGSIDSLTAINFGNNMLTGFIPTSLTNLKNLKYMYLYENDLEGPIPSNMSSLQSLEVLGLWMNNLNGTIPASLGKLPKLRHFAASNNELTGAIPPELGSALSLEEIFLQRNLLTGSIPSELGQLTKMRKLVLWGNKLENELPDMFANMASLESLVISQNRLKGPLPKSVANLKNLTSLVLADNLFTGGIPQEYRSLGSGLQMYHLYTNCLEGALDFPSIANTSEMRLVPQRKVCEIPPEPTAAGSTSAGLVMRASGGWTLYVACAVLAIAAWLL
ncbi:hypothetical protein HDU96_010588 [Phlyctochytrium bullatum]|nr:hypothetical protein HDU96_010588 [Phlyctochytrium bullatum]